MHAPNRRIRSVATRTRRSLEGLVGIASVGLAYIVLVGGERVLRRLMSVWLTSGSTTLLAIWAGMLGCLVGLFVLTIRHTDLASLTVGWPASLQIALSVLGWLRDGGPILVGAVAVAFGRLGVDKNRAERVSGPSRSASVSAWASSEASSRSSV